MKCKKYITISSSRKNQQEVLSKHLCGEKKCPECYEVSESEGHVCSMKKQVSQDGWNKISFLLFSFMKYEHNQDVPAQASLVYENKKPGNFVVKMFHGVTKTIDKEGFKSMYWPTESKRQLNEKGIRANFGKYKKNAQLLK